MGQHFLRNIGMVALRLMALGALGVGKNIIDQNIKMEQMNMIGEWNQHLIDNKSKLRLVPEKK